MISFKKTIFKLLGVVLMILVGIMIWAWQPISKKSQNTVEFTIKSGSGLNSAIRQMVAAGVPVNSVLFSTLAQLTGKSTQLKAGTYAYQSNSTPMSLLNQLVNGDFLQFSLTLVEGSTFQQMRAAVRAQEGLLHDTVDWSDQVLLHKISQNYEMPEGLFFPDTYLFPKGASDLVVYQKAYDTMLKRLSYAWEQRDVNLPYRSAYEALIMASIIEKETGQASERKYIASVFVNRLRKNMLLQTDPTVIYGMGARYHGNISKRDLMTETRYNTYMRAGLPPTPIALPGAAALDAAVHPAKTDMIYFVARGDGTSYFSNNLLDHQRAVNLYQKNIETKK